jgi:hypothetical protein
VAGVVSALIARDNIEALGEEVDNLPLTLVSPFPFLTNLLILPQLEGGHPLHQFAECLSLDVGRAHCVDVLFKHNVL